MGDRYVVGFRATRKDPAIFLYSHWGGSDRHSEVAEAIFAARPRWGDPAYATRIAISQIVGLDWDKETGFGLSAGEISCMPDYTDVAIVTWEEQCVDIVNDNEPDVILTSMSLDEYIHRASSHSMLPPASV